MTEKEALRVLSGVFLVVLSIYALTAGGHIYGRDGAAMLEMSKSFLQKGRFDVPPGINTLGGRIGLNGYYYTPFGIGQPIVASPLLGLGYLLRFPNAPSYLPSMVLSFFGTIVGAAAAAIISIICINFGCSKKASILAGFVYAFGTLAWPTSSTFYAETFTVFLLLMGIGLGRSGIQSNRVYLSLLGGSFFALMILTRIQVIILIPALLLTILDTKLSRKRLFRIVAAWSLPILSVVILIGIMNWSRFGSPFETAYTIEPDGRIRGFTTPILTGLKILFFSPGKSLFIFAPGVVLGTMGLWRKRKDSPLFSYGLLASGFVTLFMIAQWSQPEGGYCWGPRLLLPGLAPLFIGIGFFLSSPDKTGLKRKTTVILIFGIFGILVQLPGVFVSFVEVIDAEPTAYASLNYNQSFNPFPEHIRRSIHYWGRDILRISPSLESDRDLSDFILVNWVGELDVWAVHLFHEGIPMGIILFCVFFLVGLCALGFYFLREVY